MRGRWRGVEPFTSEPGTTLTVRHFLRADNDAKHRPVAHPIESGHKRAVLLFVRDPSSSLLTLSASRSGNRDQTTVALRGGEKAMGKKIFVGNLSFSTTSTDLESLFAEVGTCESVTVVTDRETGRSRGFGFVEMASASDADKAISTLNGRDVGGRQINVSEAKAREGGSGGGRRPGSGFSGRRSY
jgi:hypothetical protein